MNGIGLARQVIRWLGFEVHRYRPDGGSRGNLQASMRTARSIGFCPSTVIDVGAARGVWSAEVAQVWRDARYLLVDPLVENLPELMRTSRAIGNADYQVTAVTERAGTVSINVHPDLDGSSLFLERESNINGVVRQVPATTLDEMCDEYALAGPFLIKADVQGAELRVLRGAERLLSCTEMLVLEVLLFDIYRGEGPQFYEVISYLKAREFVVWDIFGMGYRPLDGALSQVDMAFVKENGFLRRVHQYGTAPQRLAQLSEIAATDSRRLRNYVYGLPPNQ